MIRFLPRRPRIGSKAAQRPCRPQLEVLESRLTPTFTLSVIDSFPASINLGNGLVQGLSTNLLADSNGDLFGGTDISNSSNGATSEATLFELVKGSKTLTTLATLNEANFDGVPYTLIVDGNGNIYGTTEYGGPNGDGTVFELPAGSHTITTLASFNYSPPDTLEGFSPNSLVLVGGTLYGTTFGGGANAYGTLFSVPVTGGAVDTLASFTGANGAGPTGGLIFSGGNLYGATTSGAYPGTVFSYPVAGGPITDLISSTDISITGQLAAMNGSLFGTSSGGVYTIPLNGGQPTVTSVFNNTNGADPTGGLTMDGATPVGITSLGGAINHGVVFAVQPNGAIEDLASFMGSNGGAPFGTVCVDGSGNIYGTAYGEGGNSTIVIFEGSGLTVPQLGFAASPGGGVVGQPLSAVKVAMTNAPAGSTVTLSLNSTVSGAMLSGTTTEPVFNGFATFSGLTINQPGQGYSLTATGAGLTATSGSFTIDQFPAITSPGLTTFTVGASGSFTVSDVGFPAPTLSETGKLPSGITFNAATGLLSGMPAAGALGTYPLTFKAANGLGADASQSFILIVDQSATGTTSSVSGSVFLDLAANGVLAGGDPLLAGRTVFLDKNGNGVLDPGELSAVTNSAGAFTISNVPAGTYALRVATFPGDVVTGPSGGAFTLQAGTPTVWTGLNLGLQPASIITPIQTSPAPFGSSNPNVATAEIIGLYTLILGRAADSAGLASWLAALNSGTTIGQIATTFLHTPERLTDEVKSYYVTFLGRAGDAGGIQSWVSAMQAGMTEQQVVVAFLNAPEFSQVHASNSAFVQALYGDLLGRTASASEVVSWNTALTTGLTRGGLIQDVIGSYETQKRGVDSYYIAYLGRQTDSAGEMYWVDTILNGAATLDSVAASIFGSPEFAARAAATVH